MTISLNSVRSTRLFFSTLLLLLSFGAVSSRSIANPAPVIPTTIEIAETLTAEQWMERGYGKYSQDFKGAIEDYTQAIKLDPNNADYYGVRAQAYVENNDKVRALADYNQIIKLEPERANSYGLRAIFYCNEGDYKKGITDWDQAAKMMEEYAIWTGRAECLAKSGDYKKAIVVYTNAIEWSAKSIGADPKVITWTDATVYIGRGKGYQSIGNSKAAIADFDKAVTVKDSDYGNYGSIRGDAYNQRALAKLSLGQKQAALQDFKKAAEQYGSGEEYDQIMKSIKELQ